MGWSLSKTVKNAVIVAVITALSSLVNKPIPDVMTLYQVATASALAGLLSYQQETKPQEQQQTQSQSQNQVKQAILKLLDF